MIFDFMQLFILDLGLIKHGNHVSGFGTVTKYHLSIATSGHK